jgi:hypothetical protein
MRLLLIALAVLALAAVPVAAAADFTVTLTPGAPPSFEGAGVSATLAEEVPGERVAWNLTGSGQMSGRVVSRGYFDVERPRQVAPDVDPHFDLTEAPPDELANATDGVRLLNYSREGGDLVLTMTFPLEGVGYLRLTRDVAPPNFTLGPVRNLTHQGFYVETTTDEYAWSDLVLQPAAGGEAVRNPIGTRTLLQRFPIQGLRPDTPYVWWVNFTDWSANAVQSPQQSLRTLPRPVLPAPTITAQEPTANATLAAPVRLVAVNFTGPAPANLDSVAVFVDKTPQLGNVRLLPGRVEATLTTPLGPGDHTASVELTSDEGGLAVARWAFKVGGARAALPDLPWIALSLAAAAIVARRW